MPYDDVKVSPRDSWTDYVPQGCDPGYPVTRPGTTVHWVGTLAGLMAAGERYGHDHCLGIVRGFETTDVNDKDYCAIQYNMLVCVHGVVIVGRGRNRRSATNGGNTAVSNDYGSVCVLMGTIETPTPAMLHAVRAACAKLAENHPRRILPHSHWTETQCPGDKLRAWIAEGCPDTYASRRRRIARRLAHAIDRLAFWRRKRNRLRDRKERLG